MLLLSLPDQVLHRIDAWIPLHPTQATAQGGDVDASTSFHFPQPLLRAIDIENGSREGHTRTAEPNTISTEDILAKLREDNIEILCLVEGIDAATSYTVQARPPTRLTTLCLRC